MKFRRITIRNFLGISKYELGLMGRSANIFAKNGIGKTTLKNAILWCLFEKDFRGNSLDPKPREKGGEGKRIRGLIPEVELMLELDTGETVTLNRKLEEDISKKEKLYKGDNGAWEIDGLAVNKTQYDKRVAEMIGDPEIFRVMLNPESFFTDKKWENRRLLLEKMMGATTAEDVFDGSELEILNGKPLNDAMEIAKTALKKAKDNLDDMPAKIEEAKRKVPGEVGVLRFSKEELKAQLDTKIKERQEEEERCKNPNLGKETEINDKIKKIETKAKESYNEQLKNFDRNIEDLEKRIGTYDTEINKIEKAIPRKEADLELEKKVLEKMRGNFEELHKKEFNDTKCATCGQELPQYLREEYEKKFNADKAEQEKILKDKGRSQRIDVEELEKEIADKKKALERNKEEKETLVESLKKLTDQKYSLAYEEPPEIAELRTQLNSIAGNDNPAKSEALVKLEGEEEAIRESIATYNSATDNQNRVKELLKEEEDLADTVAECQRVKDTILNMKRKWNKKIEENVNKHFELIYWRLSEEQKNGEPKDICEASFRGVDYNKTVSNGEGVNMCMDLHNSVSKFFGMSFPAIIDNAESVTDWLVKPTNQTIYLYAKENINELKMEILP